MKHSLTVLDSANLNYRRITIILIICVILYEIKVSYVTPVNILRFKNIKSQEMNAFQIDLASF